MKVKQGKKVCLPEMRLCIRVNESTEIYHWQNCRGESEAPSLPKKGTRLGCGVVLCGVLHSYTLGEF